MIKEITLKKFNTKVMEGSWEITNNQVGTDFNRKEVRDYKTGKKFFIFIID